MLTAGGAVMGVAALVVGGATATPMLFTGRLLVGAGARATSLALRMAVALTGFACGAK